MKKNNKSINEKCKKIRLVITDVDGVLTDGGMFYSKKGEILKKFNTRDGMAVELLSKVSIKTIFITKENSEIAKKRATKVKASEVFVGVQNKELLLPKICKKYKVKPIQIAYIGDDVNDIKFMKLVGFSACPNDGIESTKKTANYVCDKKGGEGAFREFVDLILSKITPH